MGPASTPGGGENRTWRVLDLLVKGLAAVLISGAITLYGIRSDDRQARTSEENRKAQFKLSEKNRQATVLVETIRSRETAAADMRAKMFGTLLEHYFGNPGNDSESRVAILEMIGHNFEEDLNLKPLFLQLEKELLKKNPGHQGALRAAARNVRQDELEKIIGAGGEVCRLRLSIGQQSTGDCVAPVEVKLLDVAEDHIGVSSTPLEEGRRVVTYYDLPLMNNRRLGELRYALVLEETDAKGGEATLLVVRLPHADYGVETRLRSDQLLEDLMEEIFDSDGSAETARQGRTSPP
ncbi:MAG: hypothetical protein L0Y66_02220 [Myxococcaceae bacterium]|nr:hypothetical protein [Myxococcaceae bacterium]MCI0670565.1 hypothetical protein [Myxococcaceae bacterium]